MRSVLGWRRELEDVSGLLVQTSKLVGERDTNEQGTIIFRGGIDLGQGDGEWREGCAELLRFGAYLLLATSDIAQESCMRWKRGRGVLLCYLLDQRGQRVL